MTPPEFHAEYNPDIFYLVPTLCWMRVEDEAGKPAGMVLQILWLNFTAQWLFD